MATPKRGGATYGTVTTKKNRQNWDVYDPREYCIRFLSLLLQQTSSPKISPDWA